MSATATAKLTADPDVDCETCSERLQEELRNHEGVVSVVPGDQMGALNVVYDPDQCSTACLDATADHVRADLSQIYRHERLPVTGMDCGECARKVERALDRMDGITHVDVSFAAARIRLEFKPETVDLPRVVKQVRSLGYDIPTADGPPKQRLAWWPSRTQSTAIAAALLLAAIPFDIGGTSTAVATILYALSIVIGGARMAQSGINGLRATHRPDMNFLMTVAVLGAVAIGAWTEGALVVVLFAIGELLEGQAVDRARRSLAELVSLAPDMARLRRMTAGGDVEEVEVLVAELTVGDQVVARPGERIAVDGAVREGTTSIDQATITGESTPIDRGPGDPVFAGTLNVQGRILIEVTAAPGDSTLDRIARLVTEAQASRSPSERWIDRFAAIYTPTVMIAAVLVAVIPPAFAVSWGDSFYSALALLILACPCALVISTPVSIVSSLARASAAGVLVKGGAHLETAAAVRTVAFDKTGTLTSGRPHLISAEALHGDEDALLVTAASLEQGSEHPLAKAILKAALDRGLKLQEVASFEALTGLGALGKLNGADVRVGNPRLFADAGMDDPMLPGAVERVREGGGTAVVVARGSQILGVIGLADELRPEAVEALEGLRQMGIERTVMLTGDNAASAEAVRVGIGLAEARSDLLPEDKVDAVAGLGVGVAMVGDGVNDAPALAASDLGIAMGSAGSDTAIEVADVALMGDDPRKVAALIGTARWTKSIVRQNVLFSLGTKLGAVVVLAFGALPLWGAVATDVGASLLVTLNGLRLLRGRPLGPRRRLPLLNAEAPSPPVADASTQLGMELPMFDPPTVSEAVETTSAGNDACCEEDCCQDDD